MLETMSRCLSSNKRNTTIIGIALGIVAILYVTNTTIVISAFQALMILLITIPFLTKTPPHYILGAGVFFLAILLITVLIGQETAAEHLSYVVYGLFAAGVLFSVPESMKGGGQNNKN